MSRLYLFFKFQSATAALRFFHVNIMMNFPLFQVCVRLILFRIGG